MTLAPGRWRGALARGDARPARWPAAAWAVPILVLTLLPGSSAEVVDPFCLICGTRGGSDGVLNMILFAPFGWAVGRAFGASRAALASLILSATIEILQVGIPGRYPTSGDIVFNSAGGTLGGLAAALSMARWRDLPLLPAAAALSLALVLAPAALLTPSFPVSAWYGQWAPDFGHMEYYRGPVLSFEIGGRVAPSLRFESHDRVRESLERGEPIRVRFLAAPPPGGLAPIVAVHDDSGREILLIGARGSDLVVRRHDLAAVLRLGRPELVWPGGLARLASGDAAELVVVREGRSMCVVLLERRRCDLAPGAESAWGLVVFPEELGGRGKLLLGFLWLAALGLPVGLASRSTGVALAVGVALAGAGYLSGALAPHLSPHLAPLTGVLLGVLIGRVFRVRGGAKPAGPPPAPTAAGEPGRARRGS